MLSIVKKIGLSVVLISALSVSANAFCYKNGCHTGEVGIGGIYSGFGGNNDANGSAYGGYIKASAQSVYYGRLALSAEVLAGGGMLNVSGASLNGIAQNSGYIAYELLPSIGFNVASKNAPLFVKAQIGADVIDNKGSLNRDLFYTGVELDGRVPLNSNFAIDYNLRYGWIFAGGYKFTSGGDNLFLTGYNHRIQASIGFDVRMTEDYAFYLKAIGRYYGLNKTEVANGNSYPAANSYSVMLELGVKGI
ncbi:hypothetical protein DCO58_12355 [Helicobacter saguini]|uniref:Outer membrane protein beta-barrel domain-containing protein n=1 Tax=Helicobacter saguini TaxID=1548018 RepID=A0A099BB26_9HELI|nr:hypothetical protein [Helicobacter saguini]MWV60918.1 hypothetical protein [Helicobacter saguini]MWV68414.1 hypothetical protein [Helicobacter saguini]MWV70122.1 hypothetical protein [Helicobacter saguini]MWV72025.1 hypothetical protein [Helicobacter saguini]TLD93751.1 hypothetical protein LS64_008130 [Helicobacter saguini]